jgi:hypothetical protein
MGLAELHNLYLLLGGTWLAKSKETKWAMHVEGIGMFSKV